MSDYLDIVYKGAIIVIVDDVSNGKGTEFRSSLYDEEDLILADGWGDTIELAINDSLTNLIEQGAR
jgi:hypothetical protein